MSLQELLTDEQVHELELNDFSRVETGESVGQAIAHLQANGHNVCLITRAGRLAGILTDRDILRKVIGRLPLDTPVETVMTADPVTVPPDFSAAEALWLLDRKGFRNLPVVDASGAILGNMTHQAVLRFLAAHYPTLVLNLPPNPNLIAGTPEGGD